MRLSPFRPRAFVLGVLVVAGCSSGSSATVTGVVTLDGSPLAEAEVAFERLERTGKGGEITRTDADGKFAVIPDKQKAGLGPGKYGVFVSKWVDRKTKQAPPAEQIEMAKSAGTVVNLLPPRYNNRQGAPVLTVEIKPGKNEPLQLTLTSK